MQKTLVKVDHSKIVFVKMNRGSLEISESVYWSRRLDVISLISVWKNIHWDPRNSQPDDTLST